MGANHIVQMVDAKALNVIGQWFSIRIVAGVYEHGVFIVVNEYCIRLSNIYEFHIECARDLRPCTLYRRVVLT